MQQKSLAGSKLGTLVQPQAEGYQGVLCFKYFNDIMRNKVKMQMAGAYFYGNQEQLYLQLLFNAIIRRSKVNYFVIL